MMIDFALAAERNEGLSAFDAISRACSLRFRPIMMTTMSAVLGAQLRWRSVRATARRAASTTQHIHHWRPVAQPVADTVLPRPWSTSISTASRSGAHVCAHRVGRPFSLPSGQVRISYERYFSLFPLFRCLSHCRVSSCVLGPNYTKPTFDMPAGFKEAQDWKSAEPSDDKPRGNWWEVFSDPVLNALVRNRSTHFNQDVQLAVAQYRQAQAAAQAARASFFPNVSVSAGASLRSDAKSKISNSFNLEVIDTSWGAGLVGWCGAHASGASAMRACNRMPRCSQPHA